MSDFELRSFGILGQLEAARVALRKAGSDGLTKREVVAAAGWNPGDAENLLLRLTKYCYVYEDDVNNRLNKYYIDLPIDDDFEHDLYPNDMLVPGSNEEEFYNDDEEEED